MPRKDPKFRYHKHSRQYFVELNSRRHYLGTDQNKAKQKYYRLLAE